MHIDERRTRERAAVEGVTDKLQAAFGQAPRALVTLGSGLGPVVDAATELERVPTTELGLPASTVPGHAGQAVLAELGGVRVLFLSGRVHRYEGYDLDACVRYVRAAWRWGVPALYLTCSAGSVRADLPPGTLTLMSDHINLMAETPLLGGPLFDGEARFPDASRAHDARMRHALRRAAQAVELDLPDAVYAALPGPAYETAAEVRMLQIVGADLVGMSTVPELLAARALDLPACALAVVSNYGAGVGTEEVDHDAVTAVANRAARKLAAVLERVLG